MRAFATLRSEVGHPLHSACHGKHATPCTIVLIHPDTWLGFIQQAWSANECQRENDDLTKGRGKASSTDARTSYD